MQIRNNIKAHAGDPLHSLLTLDSICPDPCSPNNRLSPLLQDGIHGTFLVFQCGVTSRCSGVSCGPVSDANSCSTTSTSSILCVTTGSGPRSSDRQAAAVCLDTSNIWVFNDGMILTIEKSLSACNWPRNTNLTSRASATLAAGSTCRATCPVTIGWWRFLFRYNFGTCPYCGASSANQDAPCLLYRNFVGSRRCRMMSL
jgi:hypothetical protein